MRVFVRSVYLQGLLLMPEAEIPSTLEQVVPVRRALAQSEAAVPDLPADLLTPRDWEQQRIVPSWAERTAAQKSGPAADSGRDQE